MADIQVKHQVKKIKVEQCCGSWCVKLVDIVGEEFRVARVDSWETGSKKAAQEYAKELKKVFGIR